MTTNPDFVSARRAALASAHWQCAGCGAFYPTGATCGGCEKAASIGGVVIRANDPLVEFCGSCGRPKRECDADARGCGTGAAEDAPIVADERPVEDVPPPSGWRERPPLL